MNMNTTCLNRQWMSIKYVNLFRNTLIISSIPLYYVSVKHLNNLDNKSIVDVLLNQVKSYCSLPHNQYNYDFVLCTKINTKVRCMELHDMFSWNYDIIVCYDETRWAVIGLGSNWSWSEPPIAFERSVPAWTASMMAPRKPEASRRWRAKAEVPPGEQMSSLSCSGCCCVSRTIFAAPCQNGRNIQPYILDG